MRQNIKYVKENTLTKHYSSPYKGLHLHGIYNEFHKN